jgi:hypothetical protein
MEEELKSPKIYARSRRPKPFRPIFPSVCKYWYVLVQFSTNQLALNVNEQRNISKTIRDSSLSFLQYTFYVVLISRDGLFNAALETAL